MKTSISVKNIFILLGAISGGLIVVWFVVWLVLASAIFINDAKENRERAELFYKEDVERYEESGRSPFVIKYTYSKIKNLGFYGGGGYISGTDCWERFIKDVWTREEIAFVSACDGEDWDEGAEKKIEGFWEKYKELFGE